MDGYSGDDAGNVLQDYQLNGGTALHDGMMFSTWDADNDNYANNCAQMSMGGWWLNECGTVCLSCSVHVCVCAPSIYLDESRMMIKPRLA